MMYNQGFFSEQTPIGGTKPPAGVDYAALLEKQKSSLTSNLNYDRDKQVSALDAALAARGISRSGALGAGVADIGNNYARALTSGITGLESDMAKLQQQNKYYDYLMNQGKSGASGFAGLNPAGDTTGANFTGRKPGEPMYPKMLNYTV